MRDLISFPSEKPPLPLFTDLVPLLDTNPQEGSSPPSKEIPVTFQVENFDWGYHSDFIIINATVKNNTK
jgi:hypothetical protein